MCDKEAKVHLSQVDDEGKVKKIDLCEDCAKSEGVNNNNFSLANLLVSLGHESESSDSGATQIECPHCGYTQARFKKSGRVGCPQCYDAIVPEFERMLAGMHRDTVHHGKCPKAERTRLAQERKISQLKKELAACIQDERYEDAAKLRDEIKVEETQERSDIVPPVDKE